MSSRFSAKVLQTFQKPFAALLAYPTQVDATLVRQSMRTKTWPTTVEVPGKDAQDATLVDISLQGAMIKTDSALASVGDVVNVGIDVIFDNTPVQLNLSASICHNNRASNDAAFYIGLAFKNLTQHDKLVLHFVTQAPQGQ